MDGDRLLISLRDVTHGMLDRARTAAAQRGLPIQAMLALRAIDGAGSLRPGELAAKLHITPGSLTPIIQDLEARGFVARHKDPSDGRVQQLRITAAGVALRGEMEDHMRGVVTAAFHDWDDDERERFAAALERLRERLQTQ